MKNRVKNFIIIFITLIVFAIILLFVSFQIRQNVAIFRAVVVEVYDKGMLVMGLKDPYGGLISLGFTDEGNIGFKQGQEIAINCDGVLIQTGPAQLGEVRDIKIIKEKSKTEIPENVLRYGKKSTVKEQVGSEDLSDHLFGKRDDERQERQSGRKTFRVKGCVHQ